MTRATDPAFPVIEQIVIDVDNSHAGAVNSFGGLTKREYFAAVALQGFCSQNVISKDWTKETLTNAIVQSAVIMADALIAELSKKK